MSPEASYLWRQILNHANLFFSRKALELLKAGQVRFVSFDQAIRGGDQAVMIPIDLPVPSRPEKTWQVAFNGARLTLWNRIDRPVVGDWRAVPDETAPLWYVHRTGTVLPAWNLFGNLFKLLTFGEELMTNERDKHGRFDALYSPRFKAGLLETPAFNEAVAALVATCAGLHRNGVPDLYLDKLLKPPVIVLSHDCDILLGNDHWTQLVRAVRVLAPVARAKFPRVANLWWIARNAVYPRRFYFDNVPGMIDLERGFAFTSTFYLLNGSGGRYGARSGSGILRQLLPLIPSGWDVGIHYNYDTFLDHDRFRTQFNELGEIVHKPINSGRAHYLRFDSKQSLPFLESFGIRCDESAGYAARIGYRCGIGGCFQPYDASSTGPLDIWEVPLVVMDGTLVSQYGEESVVAFRRLLLHLSRVGGAMSLVYHPGQFHNPEHPKMLGLYHRLLIECRQLGAKSETALSLVNNVSS